PRPGDPGVLPQLQEQVELLGEQLVVVVQIEAEQRERLDERPPAGHDLDPAAGDQVDGGVLLEDPDRVLRREDGDRAGQPDPLGRSSRASRGAEKSMTNSRSTWTASTNVASAPLPRAVASTA